jgi:hypothetical protein
MSAFADVWIEGNIRIRINFTNMQPQISLIRPALLFNIELALTNPQGTPSTISTLTITDFLVELRQKNIKGNEIFAGQLKLRQIFRPLSINQSTCATLIFEVAPNELRAIEKIREAQDLQLVIGGSVSVEYQMQSRKINDGNFTLSIRIPKSDWVEKFLPVFRF